MCQLFETICLQEGHFLHLPWHQQRLNGSRKILFGCDRPIDLADCLKVPIWALKGTWKCRITYGQSLGRIQFIKYFPKIVRSLTCVEAPSLCYSHKFIDRSSLALLQLGVASDDILITQEGKITDTSIANIILFDGNQWVTPLNPLLPGTTRARLLAQGEIVAKEIDVKDLRHFSLAMTINAMQPMDLSRAFPSHAIK